MQKDILFDNIYIGHSVEDAAALQKETYDVKAKVEKAEEEASKPKDEKKSPLDLVFTEDPVRYVQEKVDLFITIAKKDPVQAVKLVPEVAAGAVTALLLVVGLLSVALGGGKKEEVKKTAEKAKDAAVDAKDKAAEAVASGADKAEATKRATRSSS